MGANVPSSSKVGFSVAQDGAASQSPSGDWSNQLAIRIFAPPQRWGWQAAAPVQQIPVAQPPQRPGAWVETPLPHSPALRAARSKAISELVWQLALTAVATGAFVTYRAVIEEKVSSFGESAMQVYGIVLIVIALILLIGVIRSIGKVRRAARELKSFEQPALQLRAAEKQRHTEALRQWEEAVRQHQSDAHKAAQAEIRRSNGPLWYPVHPASDPVRVDVFGGDPRRFGWSSLAVTLGTSILSARERVTMIDFTGQDVGGSLARVAAAGGFRTQETTLGEGESEANLLASVPRDRVPRCIAEGIAPHIQGTDLRQERALIAHVLEMVIESLDEPVTFARLSAGVRVLIQGSPGDALTNAEVSRLSDRIGDIDQNEWTSRQLRFVASQLKAAHSVAPGDPRAVSLWTNHDALIISTVGARDDRKEFLDRLVLRLAQQKMDDRRWRGGVLVLCGADHLGAEAVRIFSDHARNAGVRLVLMIDQPQGEMEKVVGTGGAVCIMKMYNHRDATIAAEFVGRGHKFVLNQVTRQVGKTFTDGGGDSFSVNSGQGSTEQRASGAAGRSTGLSDSRGQAWTGVRNWSAADNISTSTGSSRVYEFVVEPGEILNMPETAFLLVDNSDQGRRVMMADANPGICLLDRVSTSLA